MSQNIVRHKLRYVCQQCNELFSNLNVALKQSNSISQATQMYCLCRRLLAIFPSLSCQARMKAFRKSARRAEGKMLFCAFLFGCRNVGTKFHAFNLH